MGSFRWYLYPTGKDAGFDRTSTGGEARGREAQLRTRHHLQRARLPLSCALFFWGGRRRAPLNHPDQPPICLASRRCRVFLPALLALIWYEC